MFLLRLRAFLTMAFEAFRFIKKYRLRQAERERVEREERAKEREHQRLIVEAIASRLIDVVKTNQDGMLALAQSTSKYADVMQTWIKGFQIQNPEPEPSSTVRDEDEWAAEEKREMEHAIQFLPAEFQLAYGLNQLDKSGGAGDPNPNFDREGSDF